MFNKNNLQIREVHTLKPFSSNPEYNEIFQTPIEFVYENQILRRKKLHFSYPKILDEKYFFNKLAELIGRYHSTEFNVFFKIRYIDESFRMVGSQFNVSLAYDDLQEQFRTSIISKVNAQLALYGASTQSISYIQLYFLPLTKVIKGKYRFTKSTELPKNLSKIVNVRSMTPVSVDSTGFIVRLFPTFDENNKSIVGLDFTLFGVNHNWKTIIELEKSNKKSRIHLLTSKYTYVVIRLDRKYFVYAYRVVNYTTVHKLVFTLSGVLVEEIADVATQEGLVKRQIGNNILYLKGERIVKSEKVVPIKAIPKMKGGGVTENPNIGVIDLETYSLTKGNGRKVYASGFKTNLEDKVYTYYIKDVKNPDEVVLNLIDELLRPKYNKITFYCHNLGGYDIVFILKVLIDYNDSCEDEGEHYKFEFKFRDSQILSVIITRKKNSLRLYDSLCMFNTSLAKLGKAYEANFVKSVFPHEFSLDVNLFYKGVTPSIDKFSDISQKEYDEIYSANWSFKEESLKYLELDLKSLYEILTKANKRIFLDYKVDITQSVTISSLALRVFLSKYYKSDIPWVKSKSVYKEIKNSYYGGRTEVFKPYGENLYYYDVNSLYPSVALQDMPGLDCHYTDYHGTTSLNNKFGFFYCRVDSSNSNLNYIGLLPFRNKELWFPTGKWEGWYFSEELRLAEKIGYKIEVIRGYSFSRTPNVFKKYVETIYKHKSNSTNITQRNIAKSLLNNLLGRFGINLERFETRLMTNDEFENLALVRDFKSHIEIGEDKCLVSYSPLLNQSLIESSGLDLMEVLDSNPEEEAIYNVGTSVPISSAVTSYGRIYMAEVIIHLLSLGIEIYYMDTDSIVVNKKLPSSYVDDKKLGKFKLEHEIARGYFVTNKTYCIVTNDGKHIYKAKGVDVSSVTEKDYIDLLNNAEYITVRRTSSIKNFSEGYVNIIDQAINLRGDSYTKRNKVYHDNKWVETKPIWMNAIDYSIVVYQVPNLSLIAYTTYVNTSYKLPLPLPPLTETSDQVTYNTEYIKHLSYDLMVIFLFVVSSIGYLVYNIIDFEEHLEESVDLTNDENSNNQTQPAKSDILKEKVEKPTSFMTLEGWFGKNNTNSHEYKSGSILRELFSLEKKTLYDGYKDEMEIPKPKLTIVDSVMDSDSSRPSTGYNLSNTPTTQFTSLYSPDLSKDQFTPSTLKCLQEEIDRNLNSLSDLRNVCTDSQVQQSVKETLLEERKYLLGQMTNHLNSVLQQAKNTELKDVDMNNLTKEVGLLQHKVNQLSKNCEELSNRRL